VASVQPAAAAHEAIPSAADPPYSPLYCFQMDMDDGIITWTYIETVDGRNIYNYRINWTPEVGTTSCEHDHKFRPGELSGDGQTCVLAGTAAVAGIFIPGVGTVNAVFFFTTTCGIALLT
jgi:hypothetical protein